MFKTQGAICGISVLFAGFFMPLTLTAGTPSETSHRDSDRGVYTAKGELELYTGIEFPSSASNFYCHLAFSSELTIVARFDIPLRIC